MQWALILYSLFNVSSKGKTQIKLTNTSCDETNKIDYNPWTVRANESHKLSYGGTSLFPCFLILFQLVCDLLVSPCPIYI